MTDPVITLSLGVVFSIIGITIAILVIIIGAWMKMNEKLDRLTSFKTDINQFHMDNTKQMGLCETHQLKLTQICGEIKTQNESQKYMVALFEDMKRLQVSTASAIHGVTNALGKLEVVMEQILARKD